MNNQRDEPQTDLHLLIKDLRSMASSDIGVSMMVCSSEDRAQIVNAILAAGFTRPRTVSTVAELDALPDEAAVLTRHGAVYIHSGNCWQGIGAGGFYSVWFEKSDSLPASVLYEPEAS